MIKEWKLVQALADEYGLEESHFKRLGRVVVLVGPNGGGKSRFLEALQVSTQARSKTLKDHMARLNGVLTHRQRSPGEEECRQRILAIQIGDDAPLAIETALKEAISSLSPDAQLEWRLPEGFEADTEPSFVILARPDLQLWPTEVETTNAEHVNSRPEARLELKVTWRDYELIWNRLYFYARMIDQSRPPEVEQKRVRSYAQKFERLQKLTEHLLGVPLSFEAKSVSLHIPLFRGVRLKAAGLSEGQRILAVWAMSITLGAGSSGKRNILILDEPEVHLHPEACMQVIHQLTAALPNAQLWVATHSVALAMSLAEAEGKNVVHLVVGGRARFAGNAIDRAFGSLLGGDQARARLLQFLSDAAEIEFYEFVVGLFLPVEEAAFENGELQTSQAIQLTSGSILDYSPGRGRIATAFARRSDPGNPPDLHMLAIPEHTPHRSECQDALSELFQDDEVRLHSSVEAARRIRADGFDWVILCNTLHEIEACDWPATFADIQTLLAEDGNLLLMEDQRLPRGELPHKRGYVVLDPQEVQTLFGLAQPPKVYSERDGRLSAIEVPRSALGGICPESVLGVLERVKERAAAEMEALRGQDASDGRKGRAYAFFALMYVFADQQRQAIEASASATEPPAAQTPG